VSLSCLPLGILVNAADDACWLELAEPSLNTTEPDSSLPQLLVAAVSMSDSRRLLFTGQGQCTASMMAFTSGPSSVS